MSEDTTIEAPDTETKEDAYSLDRKAVAQILFSVDVQDRDQLIALMDPLHPADIADLLEQINAFDRRRLIGAHIARCDTKHQHHEVKF